MRRVLGLLAVLAVVASIFPATVAGAAPTKAASTQTGVLCDLPSGAGFIRVSVGAVGADAFADITVWAPGTVPFEDLPSIGNGGSTASIDGSSLRAGFDLVTLDDGRFAGTAGLTAELTPDGAPFVTFDREGRDGNIVFRAETIAQFLTVAGTLTVELTDGTRDDVDLATCGAGTESTTAFITHPNAWVYGGPQLFVTCEWSTDAAVVTLVAISDGNSGLSQLVIDGDDTLMVGMANHDLSEGAYAASFDLLDLTSGEVPGTATAGATLSPSGDRISSHVWIAPHRLHAVGERLAVDGVLDLTVGETSVALPMDDAHCTAGDVRVRTIEMMGAA